MCLHQYGDQDYVYSNIYGGVIISCIFRYMKDKFIARKKYFVANVFVEYLPQLKYIFKSFIKMLDLYFLLKLGDYNSKA